MPQELINTIEQAFNGAMNGNTSQFQLKLGISEEQSKLVRVIIFPDDLGLVKEIKMEDAEPCVGSPAEL